LLWTGHEWKCSAWAIGYRDDLLEIKALDEGVDLLHGHIITYLGRLSQENLTEEVSGELLNLMEAANDLEAVGDIVETNLVAQGLERFEEGVSVSEVTRGLLMEFHGLIFRSFDLALQAVSQESRDAAQAVVEMKDEVNEMAARLSKHQARRLVADEPRRLETYALEIDVLKNLKRIYYFSKRMAQSVLSLGEARI
jgi:phosphate:Na+ symporter